jgi:hypothetical protein
MHLGCGPLLKRTTASDCKTISKAELRDRMLPLLETTTIIPMNLMATLQPGTRGILMRMSHPRRLLVPCVRITPAGIVPHGTVPIFNAVAAVFSAGNCHVAVMVLGCSIRKRQQCFRRTSRIYGGQETSTTGGLFQTEQPDYSLGSILLSIVATKN